MDSDMQLLRDYAENGSEAAFSEIVSRYTDLVYCAAQRQVESPDLASDVAQSVFIDLARKAPSLVFRNSNAPLVGWLYRSTRFAALTLVRDDRRRQARERLVMQDSLPDSEATPDWECVGPALDAAMSKLNDGDRDALLMRFFKKQDFRAVGTAFGISENAAQQRVLRALEKLRKLLRHHGITTTSAALSVTLSANAVQAAPAGLAVTFSTCALLSGPVISTSTAIVAAKTIAMTTLQKTLVTATVIAAVGAGIYQARQGSILRTQLQTLQQEQAPLMARVQQLEQERDDASDRLKLLAKAAARDESNALDLLRLRSEVETLRRRTNELGRTGQSGKLNATMNNATQDSLAVTNLPRESWAFTGFGTPENSLQSYLWAKSHGDVATAFASATPELRQAIQDRYFKGKSDEEISELLIDSAKNQTGIQILKKLSAAEDQVIYQIQFDGAGDKAYSLLTMKRIDGEWKVSNVEERQAGR